MTGDEARAGRRYLNALDQATADLRAQPDEWVHQATMVRTATDMVGWVKDILTEEDP